MDTLNIVIVGHVDHGKSTLIGRLLLDTGSLPESLREEMSGPGKEVDLAFITDHLEEERRKRITIDTSQVFFQGEKRKFVIIDTPGHKEFLKNTITGCCQADAAILMIDAAEGVRDQTRRHANILSLLGLRHVLVAVNKMDLVDWSEGAFQELAGQARQLLEGAGMGPPAHILPIAAKSGENITGASVKMPWHKGPSLLAALEGLELYAPEEKDLRFPVQGVFEKDGEKIIMGRIESGRLCQGKQLLVLPARKPFSPEKIFRHGEKERESYLAGECVGFHSPGEPEIRRGDVLVEEGTASLASSLRATLFWFGERSWQEGDKFLFRCATQEAGGWIAEAMKKIDPDAEETVTKPSEAYKITHGDFAEVRIELDRHVAVDLFAHIPEMGRFVLESGGLPLAGGIVTGIG